MRVIRKVPGFWPAPSQVLSNYENSSGSDVNAVYLARVGENPADVLPVMRGSLTRGRRPGSWKRRSPHAGRLWRGFACGRSTQREWSPSCVSCTSW